MSYYHHYNPTCTECKKQMFCVKENRIEKNDNIKGYKLSILYEEFICPECGITKKFTDKKEHISND